jgi:lipopolysaccharide transport system permease protein
VSDASIDPEMSGDRQPEITPAGGPGQGAAVGDPRAQWARNQIFALFHLTYYGLIQQHNRALLGLLWFLLTPLMLLFVYGFILTAIYGVDIPGQTRLQHGLLILCGMVPWIAFSDSLGTAASSVVGFPSVVRNSPLPAIFLPAVKVLQINVGLFVAYGATIVALAVTGSLDPARLFVIPIAGLCLLLFSFGISCFLAALAVYVRDVLQMLPTILLLGLFASPVLYTADMVQGMPRYVQVIVAWNPVTPFLGLFRSVVVGAPLSARDLVLAPILAVLSVVVGVAFFRRCEPGMSDSL